METELIHALVARGDVEQATERILVELGPAIYGLLVGLHGGPTEADVVFSEFTERLWRSLSTWRGECSARTWSYRIARAASIDHRRAAGRRAPHTSPSRLQDVAAAVRTQTQSFLQTERRTALQALREELPPDDQLLLVLRVDRGLAWRELAQLTLGEEPLDDEAALTRESARLRQRFRTIKKRLQDMAIRRGLLEA